MLEDFTSMQIKTSGATIHIAKKGTGEPLLLLHGFPQTHVMWHKIAPRLAESFTIILADLRGYGASSKPEDGPDHANYAKRAMAQDMVEVMSELGYETFSVAGHDRGGRVTHRLLLDHAQHVKKAAVLDIAPTYEMFANVDKTFATAYYHWFFLIQPADLPERLIGAQAEYFLRTLLQRQSSDDLSSFTAEAFAQYLHAMNEPATLHGMCEDYRAAAGIDLQHDEGDLYKKVQAPLLVLWGEHGFVGRNYEVLNIWRTRAEHVEGHSIPSGHFLPEEAPDETFEALHTFFGLD
jgi:haloacetate dehalogenase